MPDDANQDVQNSLREFIQIDLDLAFTFVDTARLARGLEHREQALGAAKKALETIRRLQRRIEDPEISNEINSRADLSWAGVLSDEFT